MERHPTGSPVFDDLLEGGYEAGVITTIYGPAGSGKSNLTLLALTTVQKKVIFIDTEGSFSVDRLNQFAPTVEDLLNHIIVLKATSLQQQSEIIDRLPGMMKDVELVVVDGIATQYRAAIARQEKDVNSELSKQMNTLYAMAMEHNIPVLLTSQVYADMESEGIKLVGGDIIRYSSKCLLELRTEPREAFLMKHRSLPERSRKFVIESVGIYEA